MPYTGVIIETFDTTFVGQMNGVIEYEVNRELNAAGVWYISVPASAALASQVKIRYLCTIIEEGRMDALLFRGIVTDKAFAVAQDGTGILKLSGLTRLFGLAAVSTHQGLAYDGSFSVKDIAEDLTGETVTAPPSADLILPKNTYSDTSKLDALLVALPIAGFDIRERWGDDSFELVDWWDRPDSGFRFINVENAGVELDDAAGDNIGIIAGTPQIDYAGADYATRIIPIGADFDGTPLTLRASNQSSPYLIRAGANPDSTSFYYIEDAAATSATGLVELPLVRSDVKNPSDDPSTKLAAANVLYAIATAELLKRRSVPVSFSSDIANGHQIDVLPGDAVKVQFRGVANTPDGAVIWEDRDQYFLVHSRRDTVQAGSLVRQVTFTLSAPDVPYAIPSLPLAIPIPPPPYKPPTGSPPSPPKQDSGSPSGPAGDPNQTTDSQDTSGPQDSSGGSATKQPSAAYNPPGAYQPCCADPSHDHKDGAKTPPTDLAPPGPPDGGCEPFGAITMGLFGGGEGGSFSIAQGAYFMAQFATDDGSDPIVTADNGDAVVTLVTGPVSITTGIPVSIYSILGIGPSGSWSQSDHTGGLRYISVASGVGSATTVNTYDDDVSSSTATEHFNSVADGQLLVGVQACTPLGGRTSEDSGSPIATFENPVGVSDQDEFYAVGGSSGCGWVVGGGGDPAGRSIAGAQILTDTCD